MPESRHKNLHLARTMRRNAKPAEKRLWCRLRNRQIHGVRFRRQVPIGPYIVDFASQRARLVVEADGGHHTGQVAEDRRRTVFLEFRGYQVLRFWNMDILDRTDDVISVLSEAVHWAIHPENPANR